MTVDVEWVEDLGSATRVRYQGRWYRAGYPADAGIFGSLVAIIIGLVLAFFAGLFFLDRALPDPEPDPAAKTEPEPG